MKNNNPKTIAEAIGQGLKVGDKIVVYSEKALLPRHELRIVKSIPEALK